MYVYMYMYVMHVNIAITASTCTHVVHHRCLENGMQGCFDLGFFTIIASTPPRQLYMCHPFRLLSCEEPHYMPICNTCTTCTYIMLG